MPEPRITWRAYIFLKAIHAEVSDARLVADRTPTPASVDPGEVRTWDEWEAAR